MEAKGLGKKLFAILLTFMMALSMTGYTFVEAFAEDGEVNASGDQTDGTYEEEGTLDETETGTSGDAAGSNDQSGETAGGTSGDDQQETETQTEETVVETETPAQTTETAAENMGTINVQASGDDYYVTVVWRKVEGAAYYKVQLDSQEAVKVEAVKADGTDAECKYIFENVLADKTHTVTVAAYRKVDNTDSAAAAAAEDGTAAQEEVYEKFAAGTAEDVKAVIRKKLAGTVGAPASYTGLSLRAMTGEANSGYAVAQGAATDGTYAYYVMASSTTQMGRILKVNLANPSSYKAGPVIGLHHANGMTYDSKRNVLVAVGYGAYRQQLTYIDPDTLTIKSQQDLQYHNVTGEGKGIKGMPTNAENNGIAAIAYVAKYDVYVARSRGKVSGYSNTTGSANNNIWVFNAETREAIGHIYTKVTSDYPETYQAMDADEKYVYFLLSPGSGQSKNVILALDWNSENLLPVLNGDVDYVDTMWACNNDGSGKPDAAITIPVAHESEGIFHTTDSSGNEHFYLSEYYGRYHYKTVTKKVKYKVKWKKVRRWYNKKTGKWQSKRPKKKYRGASKKVWKYKTKTKKVTVTEKDYWARDDYVYDLGTL